MSTNEKSGVGFVGAPPKSGELEITVIRADGRVEELGVVSEFHPNPLINWWRNRRHRKEQLRRMKENDN
jgi:hypothetical protein